MYLARNSTLLLQRGFPRFLGARNSAAIGVFFCFGQWLNRSLPYLVKDFYINKTFI